MSMTTRSTIRLRQYCLLRSAISHFSSLCWAGSPRCTAIGRAAAGSLPQFAWRVSSARQGVTIPSGTWKFDRKIRNIFGVATLLAGLCVFSTNVALTQTAAQISAAKDLLAKVARSELPSKAAQLVVDAPAKQKAAVASAVGQAVAAIHPDSASATVAAIASKVPAAAPAAAAGAAGKLPGSAPAIAVAAASVPGVAADDVRIAVTAAVPRQRAQIESALSRAKVSSSPVPATPDTSVPLARVQAPQQPVANPPPAAEAAPRAEPSQDAVDVPIIEIPKPIARPNEISISGDFLYGQGTVTLPFAFSLAKGDPAGFGPFVKVGSPDRKSDYIGATISYSFGQAWYIDASYAHGNSSGDFALPETLFGQGPSSSFKIDDDWYQAYLRYTFPGLRGKRLSAYVRAGASYVKADLSDISVFFNYEQTDKIQDILGNVGFGGRYSVYTRNRIKLFLQLEGEGFYGHRFQDTQEVLGGTARPSASIDNDLYGGIGRSTVRLEYDLGHSGLFKLFADAGMAFKYTKIIYSGTGTSVDGSHSELLWGPYAKAGLRYSF